MRMRMQMFNVQIGAIKNRQEASLVYCMNRTKSLMKTNKKTIEQSRVREGSPIGELGSVVGMISGKGQF